MTTPANVFKVQPEAAKSSPIMNIPNQQVAARSTPVQMSMSKITSAAGNAVPSTTNAYQSISKNAPAIPSGIATKGPINFGSTQAIQGKINGLAASAAARSNVVMKAHPDSFMPEFSVKGSGPVPLHKNF